MTDVLPFTPEGAESRRFFHMRDVEWRDSGSGSEEYTFTGYPVVFDSWSELLWTPRGVFRERFLHGSFEDVLANQPDVRLLKNHNKDLVLARTKSGTLEITEEEEALRNWARIAKTSYATDLKISMDRGDIDQMSVAFELDYDLGAEDRWYEDKKTGEIKHDIIKVSDVFDQSIVTFPAYAETSAVMRDLQRAVDSDRFETYTINTISPRALRQARGKRGLQVEIKGTAEASPRLYQRCRQAIAETVWAMHPSYINLFFAILDERAAGHKPTDEEIKERVGVKRDNETYVSDGVAVIPIMGPIMPRAGAMAQMSGARSLAEIKQDFRQALNDPDISAIVFDVDSPGGVADGVQEFASEIKAARGKKPITAVANYMAASAAYWIATAADELVVSPSAEVGSVGVYAAHQDRSAEMEMKGIKTTYVHAGDYKVELAPDAPLSEEAQAYLQEQVDNIYEEFVGTVAKNRGTTRKDVLANFGQGRMKQAAQAVESGMADRIATLDEVVAGLTSPKQKRSAQLTAEQHGEQGGITDSYKDAHAGGWMTADEIRAGEFTEWPSGDEVDLHIDGPDDDYYAELYTPTILQGSTEALPPHNTSVVDERWDAAEATERAHGERALRQLNAWVDGAADPAQASSYKFPHHEVDEEGRVGPANINAVMRSLDALMDSKIPNEDKEAVRRHLLRHKEAWDSGYEVRINDVLDEAGFPKELNSVFSGTVIIDETRYPDDNVRVHTGNESAAFGEWYVSHMGDAVAAETRDFLGLVATAERDPSGHDAQVAQTETDSVGGATDDVAPAETDPVGDVSVPVWKQQIKNDMQRAREAGIRLKKEMLQ